MNERDILAQKDFAVKEALAEGLAEGEARGEEKGEEKGRTEGLAEGEIKGNRDRYSGNFLHGLLNQSGNLLSCNYWCPTSRYGHKRTKSSSPCRPTCLWQHSVAHAPFRCGHKQP